MVQVALCQMGSVGTPEENMAEMERLFLQAVENSRAELGFNRISGVLLLHTG